MNSRVVINVRKLRPPWCKQVPKMPDLLELVFFCATNPTLESTCKPVLIEIKCSCPCCSCSSLTQLANPAGRHDSLQLFHVQLYPPLPVRRRPSPM